VNGTRATRVGAVFANGVAIAADNRADSYRMLTHPGVLMIPAGVATAEGEGRNGRDLLTALAAGYEVQCRCARDFIPSTPAHGFRASPVYGILGCAATTAKLMGLSAAQIVHAIALAASFAGSLIEGQRTGARDADFSESQAARNGMWAATPGSAGLRRRGDGPRRRRRLLQRVHRQQYRQARLHVHRSTESRPRRHRCEPRRALGAARRQIQDLSHAGVQPAGGVARARDGDGASAQG
jgi:hypothetical protein